MKIGIEDKPPLDLVASINLGGDGATYTMQYEKEASCGRGARDSEPL